MSNLNRARRCLLQDEKVTMLRPGSVLGLLALVAVLKIADSNRCLTMLEGKSLVIIVGPIVAAQLQRICQLRRCDIIATPSEKRRHVE